jgi:type IV conjugative transfer system lipoprotein TraV|tara:strand:+ start:2746 stop:3300 length:555 start_codon:yes stop_codon:yes gene_type:complete
MTKRTFKRLILAITVSAALLNSGCTVIGEEEFDCPNPEKGVCLAAQTAYEFAEDSEKVNSYRKFNSSSGKEFDDSYDESSDDPYDSKADNRKSDSIAKNTLRNIAPVAGTLTKPLYQPKPIIEPAKVLRVWVNVYEDASGVLHMPQTSYVEITPRKWALGGGFKDQRFKNSPPFSVVTPTVTTN